MPTYGGQLERVAGKRFPRIEGGGLVNAQLWALEKTFGSHSCGLIGYCVIGDSNAI